MLNEWNFAAKVLAGVNQYGVSKFDIDELETTNVGAFSFCGHVSDEEGNLYEIKTTEAVEAFRELLSTHSLVYSVDYVKNEISFSKKEESPL